MSDENKTQDVTEAVQRAAETELAASVTLNSQPAETVQVPVDNKIKDVDPLLAIKQRAKGGVFGYRHELKAGT